MTEEVLKKFDRYILLDCIAQGGMAELFRARYSAAEAAGRLVVIKRILAGFGKNKDFLSMFRSETTVMLGFSHPNIVQLHDFGEFEGQPYIVMEFLDGKNLRQMMSRIAKSEQKLPVSMSAFIAEQVAAGLFYAHHFKDKRTGEPLNIVHRDVSPQNVVITFDGNVKVIDFGIVKANTNTDATRVGIIKGKPSYLSPEQIAGDRIDARSDIFSLGAVLWEMLAGRKLFKAEKGENELAVLKLIEGSDTFVKPPSTVNPEVPKELDAITMRALVKNRDQRYQTAEEMQRALRKFLYAYSPDFAPADLATYARSNFTDEIVEDRKRLHSLLENTDRLVVNTITKDMTSTAGESDPEISLTPKTVTTQTVLERVTGSMESSGLRTQFELKDLRGGVPVQVQKTRTGISRPTLPPMQQLPKRRSPWVERLVGTAAVVAVITAVFVIRIGDESPSTGGARFPATPRTKAPATKPVPETADIKTYQNVITNNAQNQQRIILKIDLNGTRIDSSRVTIRVNGERAPADKPFIQVPLDAPLQLTVDSPEHAPFEKYFKLSSRDYKPGSVVRETVELKILRFGLLSVSATLSGNVTLKPDSATRLPASLSQELQFSVPTKEKRIPVGTYVLTYEPPLVSQKKTMMIKIVETKKTEITIDAMDLH